jgi:hypothetical protein
MLDSIGPPPAGLDSIDHRTFAVSDITIHDNPAAAPQPIPAHLQIKIVGLADKIGASNPVSRPCRVALAVLTGPQPPRSQHVAAASRRFRG